MASTRAPQRRHSSATRSGQHAVALLEQVGEAGGGAGVLGAGDRMAGNEVHAVGQRRPDVANHRLLDRADVRDDGAGRERRRDGLGDRGVRADRHAEHHQVRPGDRLGRVGVHRIGDAQPLDDLTRAGAARIARERAGEPVAAAGKGQGRADQADAEQCDLLEQRAGRGRSRPAHCW
jgi:hypothetical protein